MPSRKRTVKETATPNEHNVEVTDEISKEDVSSEEENSSSHLTEQDDERYTPADGN